MKLSEATILLVDDEPLLREIYSGWLTIFGCKNVYTAEDGESALVLLKAIDIDLLITDIRMPGMDGITLVRSLSGLHKPIPSILFVSGFGDIDVREMYDLGVEAFLTKPLPQDLLIKSVELALADRAGLWLEQMEKAPAQSLDIDLHKIHGQSGDNTFELGRGGFSVHQSEPLMRGKLAFRCSFSEEEQVLSGQGYVRWVSRSDDAAGIEFEYLDPRCRSWILAEIAATHPQSFIPGSRDPLP
jgi:CheY-like chemotaxis protein